MVMDPSLTPTRLQFGPFVADFRARELLRDGKRIRLQDKPMRLLAALTVNPGEVVSREHLQKQLWPDDTFVDFETGLNTAVRKLREALADNPENPQYVETIPKHGYRFLAEVRKNGTNGGSFDAEKPSPVAPTNTSLGKRTIASLVETVAEYRRTKRLWVVVAAALALGGLALVLEQLNILRVPGPHERTFGASGASSIHSLAVLPLQNLSADPSQEYFSDGMTDALITDLAQISSLKVISRTSSMNYKQTNKSLTEIARELNVDGIIEGTVQRSGDRVRITAQLIYGPSDKHLWANSYERDVRDVFALQREVTEDIAHHVQERLTRANSAPIAPPRPVSAKVLDAYFQGSYHLEAFGKGGGDDEKRKAAEYFQQAIDTDPNFAPAYNGLANSHLALLWPSRQDAEIASKAARQSAALDPSFSDAHRTLGDISRASWNWSASADEYRRAIAINPNNADAHDWLGHLLDATGRLDEGWSEQQLAQELDPNHNHLAEALSRREQHDRAIAMLQMMLKRFPDDGFLHVALCREYFTERMYEEATFHLDQISIQFGLPQIAAEARQARAVSGYPGAIRASVKGWERMVATRQAFVPVNIAEFYVVLGDKDRAFYWLEQAYAHHDAAIAGAALGLEWLNTEVLLDPLRSDARFKDLLHRVGLPELELNNSTASRQQNGQN